MARCSFCFNSFHPATRVPFVGLCGHSICQECTYRTKDCPDCLRLNAFASSGRNILGQELLEEIIRLKADHDQVLQNHEQDYHTHWIDREERHRRELQQLRQQIEGRKDDKSRYENIDKLNESTQPLPSVPLMQNNDIGPLYPRLNQEEDCWLPQLFEKYLQQGFNDAHQSAPSFLPSSVENEDETIKRNRKSQFFKKFRRMIPFIRKKNISTELLPVLVTNLPLTNEAELESYFNAVTSVIFIDEREMQTGDAIVYHITKKEVEAAYAKNGSVMMGTNGEEKSIIVEKIFK